MKFNKIIIVFYFINAITAFSQNVPIYKTTENKTIDGDFSDWKTPFSSPFVIHNSGNKSSQNTMVSLSWNDENLYIAYKSSDSNIIGKSQPKDSKIYETDDLVELFMDPDGDGKNYIEIGVNAYSTNYDLVLKCVAPECGGWKTVISFDIMGMEAISKITSDGFNTEIKIPFSSLEKIQNGNFTKPKAGTKWKGNAFRIDYGNTTEYLALQYYKSGRFGFHHPEEFAVLEFVE